MPAKETNTVLELQIAELTQKLNGALVNVDDLTDQNKEANEQLHKFSKLNKRLAEALQKIKDNAYETQRPEIERLQADLEFEKERVQMLEDNDGTLYTHLNTLVQQVTNFQNRLNALKRGEEYHNYSGEPKTDINDLSSLGSPISTPVKSRVQIKSPKKTDEIIVEAQDTSFFDEKTVSTSEHMMKRIEELSAMIEEFEKNLSYFQSLRDQIKPVNEEPIIISDEANDAIALVKKALETAQEELAVSKTEKEQIQETLDFQAEELKSVVARNKEIEQQLLNFFSMKNEVDRLSVDCDSLKRNLSLDAGIIMSLKSQNELRGIELEKQKMAFNESIQLKEKMIIAKKDEIKTLATQLEESEQVVLRQDKKLAALRAQAAEDKASEVVALKSIEPPTDPIVVPKVEAPKAASTKAVTVLKKLGLGIVAVLGSVLTLLVIGVLYLVRARRDYNNAQTQIEVAIKPVDSTVASEKQSFKAPLLKWKSVKDYLLVDCASLGTQHANQYEREKLKL